MSGSGCGTERRRWAIPVVAGSILLSWSAALADSSGPSPGMTGVPAGGGFPAEATCQSCHASLALNPEPRATFELTGVPDRYEPGKRYPLVLEVKHEAKDRLRWGFQITAIDLASYTRAGRFEITNPDTTQLVVGGFGDREYVEHSYLGTGIGRPESMRWEFAWVAPGEAEREVGFFAVVNVSNADGAKGGDWIYTRSPSPLATTRGRSEEEPK